MVTDKFNKKPHYPFTYGDKIEEDEIRLSDYCTELLANKRFQKHMGAVVLTLVSLGSYAQPSSAIPIEYGEAAAEAAQAAQQIQPPLGGVAGVANNAQKVDPLLPIPQHLEHVGQAGNGPRLGPTRPGPAQPNTVPVPAWRLPGPPTTPAGQYMNTVFLIGSVGWICLNASWGNPVFAYGCIGVVGGILNELRKRY